MPRTPNYFQHTDMVWSRDPLPSCGKRFCGDNANVVVLEIPRRFPFHGKRVLTNLMGGTIL